MKVSDLAQDLDLAESVVLEQCRRLGLDASDAGAELSSTDVVVLRAELANEGSSEGTDASEGDEVSEGDDDDGEVLPAALPVASPSAVGSIPGLVEELTVISPGQASDSRLPGGIRVAPSLAAAAAPSPDVERPAFNKGRRWEPSLRPAIVGILVAGAAFVGSNFVDHPVAILVLWVVVMVALAVSLLGGNRARYHITNHPDQRKGLGIAVALLVLAVAGSVGFGAAVWTVLRSEAPADAPAGLGELSSVQRARWSQQRLMVVFENGWHRPAKDVGTCWEATGSGREQAERIEVGGDSVDCSEPHGFEVIGVYSVDRDADSPYPGVDSLQRTALERCKAAEERLRERPAGLHLLVEYPTEQGWSDADHDVACVAAALSDRRLGR